MNCISGLESSTISGIHYSKKGLPPFVFDSQRVGRHPFFFLKKRWTKSKSEKNSDPIGEFQWKKKTGILSRSLQKSEKATTLHLHIWISLPHLDNPQFMAPLPTSARYGVLEFPATCPEVRKPAARRNFWTFLGNVQENLYRMFQSVLGRARNK